jgi:hypothetical protein
MLTERIVGWVDGHVASSPWTAETQAVIERYAGPPPLERRTQYQELALVVAHALVMIPFVVALAFAGALSSGLGIHGATTPIYRIGVGGLTWCCVGLALHLVRYYGALLAGRRSRGAYAGASAGTGWRWPRMSSDLDFILQAVVAAIAAVVA